jgi:hypothetical protein
MGPDGRTHVTGYILPKKFKKEKKNDDQATSATDP